VGASCNCLHLLGTMFNMGQLERQSSPGLCTGSQATWPHVVCCVVCVLFAVICALRALCRVLRAVCCAARSGQGLSSERLVEVVAKESAGAIRFLQGLGLNLASIQQLGGHSG